MTTATTKRRSPESSRRRARKAESIASASVGSGPGSGMANFFCPPPRSAAPCTRNPATAKKDTLKTTLYQMEGQERNTGMRRNRTTRGRDESLAALSEWFWAQAERTDSCWRWHGTATYGGVRLGGGHAAPVQVSPHRLAWMLTAGSIPEGLVVCHACDTPSCVRPTHLFLGTQGDNVRDARDKDRLVPPRGERNGNARLTV